MWIGSEPHPSSSPHPPTPPPLPSTVMASYWSRHEWAGHKPSQPGFLPSTASLTALVRLVWDAKCSAWAGVALSLSFSSIPKQREATWVRAWLPLHVGSMVDPLCPLPNPDAISMLESHPVTRSDGTTVPWNVWVKVRLGHTCVVVHLGHMCGLCALGKCVVCVPGARPILG